MGPAQCHCSAIEKDLLDVPSCKGIQSACAEWPPPHSRSNRHASRQFFVFLFFRPPKVVANGTEIVVSRFPCVNALIPRGGDDEGDTCFLRVIPAATPN